MAFALRKHDSEFNSPPMSDMNVTPLVDVMLVLLIVFMVAAPLMAAGVPVDLPKAQAKPLVDQKQPIAVSIDAAGKYFVDQREVAADELIMRARRERRQQGSAHPCARRQDRRLWQGHRGHGPHQFGRLHKGRPGVGVPGSGSPGPQTAAPVQTNAP